MPVYEGEGERLKGGMNEYKGERGVEKCIVYGYKRLDGHWCIWAKYGG